MSGNFSLRNEISRLVPPRSESISKDELPPTPRSGVTVIAVACNESTQIDEWLDGLRWVDRIVVVDTGSRDGTPDILRARGVEVISSPASQAGAVVHTAKNVAIDAVDDGWVLDLDLDERVSIELRDEILRRTRENTAAAFRIPFRHYVFGRWMRYGGWRGAHLRLYRAGSARYPEDRAHSTLEVDGEVGELDSFVVHFAHPLIHDFWVKLNRYTSHDAPLIAEHGRGGLRNRPRLPVRRWTWLRASMSVFWNRYVKSAGFRDGVPGFIVAVLMAAYVFVEQVKVWEIEIGADRSASSKTSEAAV